MSSSVTIHYGSFAIAFASLSKPIANYLQDFFRGYECDGRPDITIRIVPSESMPHPLSLLQKEWTPLSGNENSFEIGPEFFKGCFNPAHDEITLTVHPEVFLPKLVEVFQSFLYRLYHELCLHNKISGCFIHGCGVIDNGTGYLFIGPHQSGKTTIGQTSRNTIIHDDQILLMLRDGGITIDSPPLPARDNLRQHPDETCFIERIFVIHKDTAFSVKPLDPEQAVAALYNEIVLPLTLGAGDNATARKRKARLCIEILNTIPLYELRFDREGNFWDMFRNMQWP